MRLMRRRRRPRREPAAHRPRPGAEPGTLVAAEHAVAPRITALLIGEETEAVADCAPDDIPRLRERAAVLWVDVSGLADPAVIEQVGDAFGLHRLALEDVVNVHERAKTEPYADHIFVVARMVDPGDPDSSEQFSCFFGDGFVVTFQERPGDVFDAVRDRIHRSNGAERWQRADYLAYALIDTVIDAYFPALEVLGERIEALEDEVIADPDGDQADRIHAMKREVLGLRRMVWPMREMVSGLQRDASRLVSDETRVYLRDCYDHVAQLMDAVETQREIAAGLLDVYLSTSSARLNEVMKVLTIISTIFIPLSFIVGLYGMNFDTASPWNMPELGFRYGYPVVVGVMLVIAGGLLIVFRRRGWLRFRSRH